MNLDKERDLFLLFLLCGLVTWLPRIIPFVFSKKVVFPSWLERFLSYLPICILVALFIQSILVKNDSGFPTINGERAVASIPTIIVAFLTKNLLWTVSIGILSMAFIRLIF